MKKFALGAGLFMVLLSVGVIHSDAYSVGYSNVYYHSSPYDVTPSATKYSESSYGINTTQLNSPGTIYMWPIANNNDVHIGYDVKQQLGTQRISNWAVETFGPGCSTYIQFKLDTWFWDTSRSTSSGTWQPDV
jgi:hypothetical protein